MRYQEINKEWIKKRDIQPNTMIVGDLQLSMVLGSLTVIGRSYRLHMVFSVGQQATVTEILKKMEDDLTAMELNAEKQLVPKVGRFTHILLKLGQNQSEDFTITVQPVVTQKDMEDGYIFIELRFQVEQRVTYF